MNPEDKISPAFAPFLAQSGPTDKRDAIVIYKADEPGTLPVRGRLRELKKRLDYVKDYETKPLRGSIVSGRKPRGETDAINGFCPQGAP